ncbi:MAG TPA: 50S ribosomal protein L10 [Solirubrobacteraceae bacterium]|jgi:large subunit ribosomal protein L10|nr:50S ribosomal protein L10 [Solirubrobacteraceae bacterium]
MNRDAKAAVIDEIAADISDAQAIFAIDYRGISVAQADQLRARLREADAVFRVVKNSLTERAAAKAGAEELLPLLQGPTALTFVRGDAAAAAKAVADFTRATQLMAFKGGLMDGAVLSSADVAAISRLPARDVLYGQLVGLIASPIAGLARTLNALIGGLAVGLGGVLAQKEADPAFAAAAPPAPAEEAASSDEAAAAEEPAGDGGANDEADGEADAEAEETAAEVPQVAEDSAGEVEQKSAGGGADEASPSEGEAEAEDVPQVAEDARSEESEATGEAEAAAQDEPATDTPAEASEDVGDGDAAGDAPEAAEPDAAADADTSAATNESAPEAPSGDDDKEDQ